MTITVGGVATEAAAGGSAAAGGVATVAAAGGVVAGAPSVACSTSRLGDSDINIEKYASCRSGCSATPSRTRWISVIGLSA